MIFRISRVSNWGENKQPCEEAVKVDSNVRKDGHWEVEIKSLKHLVDFMEKYGQLIVGIDIGRNVCIDIYDDCAE
jgi:hypothetical protein